MNTVSFHIYSSYGGGRWLSDDEKHWTSRFDEAASFTSYKLAADIAERESEVVPEASVLALCEG